MATTKNSPFMIVSSWEAEKSDMFIYQMMLVLNHSHSEHYSYNMDRVIIFVFKGTGNIKWMIAFVIWVEDFENPFFQFKIIWNSKGISATDCNCWITVSNNFYLYLGKSLVSCYQTWWCSGLIFSDPFRVSIYVSRNYIC